MGKSKEIINGATEFGMWGLGIWKEKKKNEGLWLDGW